MKSKSSIKAKQAAEQAVVGPPPPAFISNVIKEAQKEAPPVGDQDQQLILQLAESDSWKVLKRYIEREKETLRTSMTESANKTGDLQEIGLRYIVFEQIVFFGDKIIKFVERSRKSAEMEAEMEKQENEQGESTGTTTN